MSQSSASPHHPIATSPRRALTNYYLRTAASMVPLYQPLETSEPHIRLLQIESAVEGETIRCRLHSAALATAPSFTALSYVWGDASITESVLIDEHPLNITTNLALAFRYVQQHWCSRFPNRRTVDCFFWADAVCINQADILERNKQVQFMHLLFSTAELVISWLGNDPEISLGLDTFRILAKNAASLPEEEFYALDWMENFPCLLSTTPDINPYGNNHWKGLAELSFLPYWKRIWIFQELAFGRTIAVCTDTSSLDISAISLAAARMRELRRLIKQGNHYPAVLFKSGFGIKYVIRTPPIIMNFMQELDYVRTAAEKTLSANSIIERASLFSGDGWAMSLYNGSRQATDPKDHIYASMNISCLGLEPDYSENTTVRDVYRDYVAAMLATPRTIQLGHSVRLGYSELDFLHWAGTGLFDNPLDLPSWAPNFPEDSQENIFVGPFPGHANETPVLTEHSHATIQDDVFIVSGIHVDDVAVLGPTFQDANISDGSLWRYIMGLLYRDYTSKPSEQSFLTVLRTLQLDTTIEFDTETLMFAWQLLALYAGNEGTTNVWSYDSSSIEEVKLKMLCKNYFNDLLGYDPATLYPEDLQLRDNSISKIELSVAQHHNKSKVRWRFFETTTGKFGLCPLKTMLGEKFFVIKGFNVPLMLRKHKGHYVTVGPCFMVDYMNGEAGELVKAGDRVVETVKIL